MEDFDKKVSQYQLDIIKERACWQANDIVVTGRFVDVIFSAWIIKDELAENETLLEDEDFFEKEENREGGLFEAEIRARLEADNGESFTALELLYKTRQTTEKQRAG